MKKNNYTRFTILIIATIGILTGLYFLFMDLKDSIKLALDIGNWEPVSNKFSSYGFWAPFFIGLLQAILILLTFIPAAPLQIIAGVALKPISGFLAIIAGVFVGNLIMFLLVKTLGSKLTNYFNNKSLDKVGELVDVKEERVLSKRIIVLYFFPIIPYGLIAFTVANSKIKFWKYMFITTIGTIPSILISLSLGSLIIDTNYLMVGILIAILILLTIVTAKYYQQVIKVFSKKPKKDMEFFQKNVRKANPFLYTFFRYLLKWIYFPKVNLKIKGKEYKKYPAPYILLYNHPSMLDWMYSFIPLYPKRISPIMAYYYFCNYRLGRLLHKMGGFPKFLFQPDISSIKNIKKVVKWNGILGIAPEGRLSAYGQLETITNATGKLLKHLGLPVILAKIDGAYLTFPKWAKNIRKGRVDVTYQEILTAADLKTMSIAEIDQVLYEKMNYDDFKWQEENRVYFKGKKFAEGLEHILYVCPVCKHEFTTMTKDDHLYCTHCGMDVHLDNYYGFHSPNPEVPNNIRDWYLFQKEYELQNIDNPNYCLTSPVTLKLPDPKGKGFVVVGQGSASLTHQGVTYQGTMNAKDVNIEFKIQNIPAIPFGVNEDFEIYHHNTLYYFIPENIRECVKWSIVGELIHQKYLKENNLS